MKIQSQMIFVLILLISISSHQSHTMSLLTAAAKIASSTLIAAANYIDPNSAPAQVPTNSFGIAAVPAQTSVTSIATMPAQRQYHFTFFDPNTNPIIFYNDNGEKMVRVKYPTSQKLYNEPVAMNPETEQWEMIRKNKPPFVLTNPKLDLRFLYPDNTFTPNNNPFIFFNGQQRYVRVMYPYGDTDYRVNEEVFFNQENNKWEVIINGKCRSVLSNPIISD